MESELDILNKVKQGEISAEEGARRLRALEDAPPAPQTVEILEPRQPDMEDAVDEEGVRNEVKHWQNWWLYPLWVGVGIFVFAAGLMSWGYTTERFFWFYCAWLPLLLGLLVMVLAAWSKQARWLHVRVQKASEEESHNIRISFPIPIRFAGQILRLVGPNIPELKEKDLVNTVLPVLDTLGSSRDPMVVEVDAKDGEKVQVYIV